MSTPATDPLHKLAFTYKRVQCTHLLLDVYPPVIGTRTKETTEYPMIIYFHGGGLTVGNRESWFPRWLHRRTTAVGCAFISVEYRLIPPSSGNEILEDVQDALQFIAQKLNNLLQDYPRDGHFVHPFTVDPARTAVVGTSSGGLCAYLAALHAFPRPKAVLTMYGMGGNMLTPHYFAPKSEVFFRGRELLDPERFADYLYPTCQRLQIAADSPLAYHPSTSTTPGYPANPRMQLARLYLQLGTFLDYYTGRHEPSISATLRETSTSLDREPDSAELYARILNPLVPSELCRLFPQLLIPPSKSDSFQWPPTFLVHGTADTALSADESRHLAALLQRAGVDVTLQLVEGKEHSFDYAHDAEDLFGGEGGLFDAAVGFLAYHLGASGNA